MPNALLAPGQRRSVVLFSSGYDGFQPKCHFEAAVNGKQNLVVENVPVFRSGQFSDSRGIQHTWEPLHMSQMLTNFNYLKDNGTFPEVPVRKGHGGFLSDPMDSLIGWHTGLSTQSMKSPVDGQEYDYLLASFSIFDADAAQHIAAGDWPNRSSEIGNYVNNAESEYWPAYMGFAYVDIPAVEGLNFHKYEKVADGKFSILVSDKKEFGVTAPANNGPTAPAGQASAGLPDPIADAAAAQALAARHANAAAAAAAAHAATQAATTFTINGQAVSDFAAVQAHIATLEAFQSDQITAGRTSFVSSLAAGTAPKIAQTQVESLTKLVHGMTNEQFEQFKASYDLAPANTLFAQHGQTNASGQTEVAPAGGAGVPVSPAADRLSIVTETVSRHRLTGMKDEDLKKTASYIEMQQLTAAAAIK